MGSFRVPVALACTLLFLLRPPKDVVTLSTLYQWDDYSSRRRKERDVFFSLGDDVEIKLILLHKENNNVRRGGNVKVF